MRLVLGIGVSVAVLQQITGINSVFFYAPMIFEQSGIGTDASFMQAVLVGLVNLVFTVLAILFIDRIGRRPLLAAGLTGIALCMLLLSYGFGSDDMNPTIILVGILGFVASFAVSRPGDVGAVLGDLSESGSWARDIVRRAHQLRGELFRAADLSLGA